MMIGARLGERQGIVALCKNVKRSGAPCLADLSARVSDRQLSATGENAKRRWPTHLYPFQHGSLEEQRPANFGSPNSACQWIHSKRIELEQYRLFSTGRRPLSPHTLNEKIIDLGRDWKWQEILLLHQGNRHSFDHINYSTAMSQIGRIRAVRKDDALLNGLLADIDQLCGEKGLNWLGPRATANTIHAIGKMDLKHNDSALRIVNRLGEGRNAAWFVESGSSQDVANTVWAFAKLGVQSPNLFSKLERSATRFVERGTPQAIANAVWACATLGVHSPQLFAELERKADWLVQHGKPQNVANAVWACATLDVQSPNLFSELERNASSFVQDGKPQEIANTVWACAKLGVKSPTLFSKLEYRANWLFRNGTPQATGNTVWACATLGVNSPKLFRELECNATRFVKNGKPQEIANAVWACATLGIKSPNLFKELDRNAAMFVKRGTSQAIVNAVWACATLGCQSPNLFDEVERNATRFTLTQEIANTAWACATLKVQSPNIFGELDHRATWFVQNATPQETANAVWACAALGSDNSLLFSALGKDMIRFMASRNAQNISNVCYAMAVLNVHQLDDSYESMLKTLWNELLQIDTSEFKMEALQQILYVLATAQSFGVALASPSAQLQQKLDTIEHDISSSHSEKDVSSRLQEMGFAHSVEVSPLDAFPGLFAIDIACKDRKIAIEYDGPSHFLAVAGEDGKLVENGPTKAKRRLLERLGWQVVNLDWKDAMQHEISEDWLRHKICEVGIDL